jgi:hypothetical protein
VAFAAGITAQRTGAGLHNAFLVAGGPAGTVMTIYFVE